MAKHEVAEEICDVEGCKNVSERSVNRKQMQDVNLQLKDSDIRQVHLCKEHYRAFKKESKTARSLDSIY